MKRSKTLPAFTPKECNTAHILLATRVAFMMGRKMEEGDWSSVYCRAKGIPERSWSNLNIDVMHEGLGVEHKMLRVPPETPMQSVCGTRPMHPSATRSIRIPSTDGNPNDVMREVLGQYAKFIDERKRKVAEDSGGKPSDLRTGWLFWQTSLREFLYFEEEMLAPDPDEYFAEWRESGGGVRKASKNLWVWEKETGVKRYSITTSAGAKIQPYFDVPPPNDPYLYMFKVQGEEIGNGAVRIWVASSTARELERVVGELNQEKLNIVIASAAAESTPEQTSAINPGEEAVPLTISSESYKVLTTAFPNAVSDEHMAQMLIHRLRG